MTLNSHGLLERLLVPRRIPLVAAFQALPEVAARFRELHLGPEVPALRTLLRHRFVPRDEITRLVRARVERRPAFLLPPLHELATVLWTENSGGHAPSPAAFRERAAAEELAAAAH